MLPETYNDHSVYIDIMLPFFTRQLNELSVHQLSIIKTPGFMCQKMTFLNVLAVVLSVRTPALA